MAEKMSTKTVRMNEQLNAQVTQLLDRMGLTFNTFVNMASIQLVSRQRLPFEVIAPQPVPALQTQAVNGIAYLGEDERGYPMVDIPERLVYAPRHDADGTPVLPREWADE